MRILGIDPGYAIVGYGLIDFVNGKSRPVGYGVITTTAGQDFSQRLEQIYDQLSLLIATHKPEVVALEKLFFQNNQKTAINVAEARGVIMLACKKAGIELCEYTPLQVKVAITGYGRALKPQIMGVTQKLLGLKEIPRPDDAADALALAICHSRMGATPIKRDILRRNKSGTAGQ